MKMRVPFLLLAVSILVILSQHVALACPVCFGALDDPATNGLNYAIFTLLGVTGSILAVFFSFVLRLRRLSRLVGAKRGEP
jgi:hypothetical protein